ncbi:sensor histidine kinase [Arcticibacterium luteifluviistationis]|uniref:histidine kinase n=1 Tax=Arcticibacterium luteifluviistationis TaxID=1784714 RepID=A0A2Z4G9L0_9BACT|nr:ATP-binding protein [Arcticibacterium luteifluviistationis]AWV97907.1 histidine kinase [Arcticibacterium luteifluviistationis]
MQSEEKSLIVVVLLGTGIFLLFGFFVISFLVFFRKKQIRNRLEKASLQAQFQEEILTAKNEVQENTMKHIARELHDNIGQLLSLVKIQLNTIDEENPGIKRVGDSKEFLGKALKDLRALSKTLNSDNVLKAGLIKAITFELDRVRRTEVYEVNFVNDIEQWDVNPKIEVIVFRIFQEVIQNIFKHSGAKNINVSLQEMPEVYTLVVLDDGSGFDIQAKSNQKSFNSGAGLSNLAHRAQLISGDFEIESAIGKGTKVKLSIPKTTTSHDQSRPNRRSQPYT